MSRLRDTFGGEVAGSSSRREDVPLAELASERRHTMSRLRTTFGGDDEGSFSREGNVPLIDHAFYRALVRTPRLPRLGFIPRYLPDIYRGFSYTTMLCVEYLCSTGSLVRDWR